MGRREDLTRIVCKDGTGNDIKAQRLIDEVIYIEEQLAALKEMPLIRVNPKNPLMQKKTAAANLYKELLQQYTNALKLLFRLSGDIGGDTEEESPLRRWVREFEREETT